MHSKLCLLYLNPIILFSKLFLNVLVLVLSKLKETPCNKND